MGVLDKLLDVVKLNDDYDDEDFFDDDILDEDDEDFLDDEDDEEKPVKKFFQKFGKKKDEEDFLDEDEEDEIEEVPVKAETKQSTPKPAVKPSQTIRQDKPVRTSSKITPMRSSRRSSLPVNMEVCVIKPSSMEDTREIADTLVEKSTVVLNL